MRIAIRACAAGHAGGLNGLVADLIGRRRIGGFSRGIYKRGLLGGFIGPGTIVAQQRQYFLLWAVLAAALVVFVLGEKAKQTKAKLDAGQAQLDGARGRTGGGPRLAAACILVAFRRYRGGRLAVDEPLANRVRSGRKQP